MISKKEEQIYNAHLYASRSIKNKPTRFRSNFKNIDSKDELYLKKLSRFFYSYKHINLQDWFIAPYKVYNDCDGYYELHFYTTRKALKCYTMYMKQRETRNPDSDESVDHIKTCLAFVYNYCKDNNLTIEEYKTKLEGSIPTILVHLKEHKITFYMLHLLEVDAIIKSVEASILNFIVSDFWNIYSQTRVKYVNSKQLKQKAKKGRQLVETKLAAIINNKQ